ncbi:hypothetical protein RS130_17020 [Paraglaciecola aquimarina]|uniref:Uncharacterized protein n=1 Tax=Paraglaciecola aquimarina TaxID=1235557 RepID=A0ABU3SZE3_9ALTE|nr:hypothetical protein [Paraglaciecola aquimarina]MDU0355380.1 hypothetical protein [Paraglaciecola aquimarina]
MTYPIHHVDTDNTISDEDLKSVIDDFIAQKASHAKKILVLPLISPVFILKLGLFQHIFISN